MSPAIYAWSLFQFNLICIFTIKGRWADLGPFRRTVRLVRLRLSVWLEMNDVGLHPVKPGFIIPSQKTLKQAADLFALLTRMYPKCVKTEDKVERFVNDLLVSAKHVPMPPELALLDCVQMVEFLSQNLRSFPTHPDLHSLSTDAFLTYLNDHGAFDPDPRFDQCCVFRNKTLLMEKLRELKVRFEDFLNCKPKGIKVLEWCRLHWWLNEVVLSGDERLTGIKVQDLMSREESHWVGIVSDIRASRPQKRIRH